MRANQGVLSAVAGAAMLASVAAHAASGPVGDISTSGNPSNWRLLPGQTFNGVSGAFDGVARLLFDTLSGILKTLH